MQAVPVWEKYSMTIEQASLYFGIGQSKIRWLIETNRDANWLLFNGTKTLIKRRKFEEFLDKTFSI